METGDTRRRWPRLVLTIPPAAAATLGELARGNFRDRRQEALRILLDGIEHAASHPVAAVKSDDEVGR
jgi:hypothetical protein